ADWKKNPERFAGRQLEKILPDRDRHKIDNHSSRQKCTIQPPPTSRSTRDLKPSLPSFSISGDGKKGAITDKPSFLLSASMHSRILEKGSAPVVRIGRTSSVLNLRDMKPIPPVD